MVPEAENESENQVEEILSTRLSSSDKLEKDEFILGIFEDGFVSIQDRLLKIVVKRWMLYSMSEAKIANCSVKSKYWKVSSNLFDVIFKNLSFLRIFWLPLFNLWK